MTESKKDNSILGFIRSGKRTGKAVIFCEGNWYETDYNFFPPIVRKFNGKKWEVIGEMKKFIGGRK